MDDELPTIKTEPELIIDDYDIDLCLLDYNNSIADTQSSKFSTKCEIDNSKTTKQFKCENCDTSFDQKRAKERHILFVHTHELPFTCDICKGTFVDKSCLRNHMQSHIPYSCTICNERFRHQMNFKRHMLVHTGRRPYPCKLCKRSYKHSSHLKRHLRHHADGRQYKDTKPLKNQEDGSRKQKLIKLSKLDKFRKKVSRYINFPKSNTK